MPSQILAGKNFKVMKKKFEVKLEVLGHTYKTYMWASDESEAKSLVKRSFIDKVQVVSVKPEDSFGFLRNIFKAQK